MDVTVAGLVNAGAAEQTVKVKLKRWFHVAKTGWYSGNHDSQNIIVAFRPDVAILCQPGQRSGEIITSLVDRRETIRVSPFGAFVALETKSQGVALGFSMDDPLGRIAAGIAVQYCYGNACRDTNPQENFQTPGFTMAPSSCSAASRF